MSVLLIYSFYLAVGVFAGLLAGIMGIGGGIIVVPALLMIFQYYYDFSPSLAMPMATGTSLAIMIFTSQAAIRAHYQLEKILWPVYFRLLGGLVIGAMIGCVFASILPTRFLELFLAFFLLAIAAQRFFSLEPMNGRTSPSPWLNRVVSLIIGFNSGLLGIGGGTFVVPYLTYSGVELRKTAAISSLCTLTVSIIGTITFMIIGASKDSLPAYSTGFVYWPAVLGIGLSSCLIAPVGARLTYIVSVKKLHYGFIVILLLTAVSLIF